jgi:hypothetical protein
VLNFSLFSLLDVGAWLAAAGDWKLNSNKSTPLFFFIVFRKVIGLTTMAFCFCCVAWQAVVCLEKYNSQPVSTNMALVPNEGRYPAAVTFCKLYTNFASPDISHEEITNNILRIEAEYFGTQKWGLIYDEGFALNETGLPYRQFTTFSEYENTNTVKGCVSLKLLGTKAENIKQIKITNKWAEDCGRKMVLCTPNMEIFVHGWGSFGAFKSVIPLSEMPQIFQLTQEAIVTLSTSSKMCSFYRDDLLDECLEIQAVMYANATVGCVTELHRYFS